MQIIRYVGYLLTSGVFILGGAQAFMEPEPRAAKAPGVGLPESSLAVQLNAAIMVGGGAALALGVFPRIAASALAASLIPTTIIGHAFWNETNPKARNAQQIQFVKNMAMLAALVFIMTEPAHHE